MPSAKRERQRQGRVSRREQLRAAQRRRQARRRVVFILVAVSLIGATMFLIATSGDGGDDTADNPTTTTTDKPEAAKFVAGKTKCPEEDGSSPKTAKFDDKFQKCIDFDKKYSAAVETDIGTFTIELDDEKAPTTVNNFVALARSRAYEDVPFHRVIQGFMIQGGDVEMKNGSGGPGYQFDDELPSAGEYELGSVAMANSGPDTNGSQFFVVTGPQGQSLPPNYSLFGKVTAGFEEVVKKIEADGAAGEAPPKVVHKIVKITITES